MPTLAVGMKRIADTFDIPDHRLQSKREKP
jgi:hypothetical protein